MKILTIQEFDHDYIMINEKEMLFEDYPEKNQFEYIANKIYHEENKDFTIEYSSLLADILFGEIGKHRMDGVPYGYNAYIITIVMEGWLWTIFGA